VFLILGLFWFWIQKNTNGSNKSNEQNTDEQ
jgi:hypothetical protein